MRKLKLLQPKSEHGFSVGQKYHFVKIWYFIKAKEFTGDVLVSFKLSARMCFGEGRVDGEEKETDTLQLGSSPDLPDLE